MVTKSKLRMVIAAEKGVDFKKLKEKKRHIEKAKRKRESAQSTSQQDPNDAASHSQESSEAGGSDEEDIERGASAVHLDAINESDSSDSSLEFEQRRTLKKSSKRSDKLGKSEVAGNEDEEEEEEDEEDDIPVSDLEDLEEGDKDDLIPHTKLTINNTHALEAALKRISLLTNRTQPFATHQTVVSSTETAASIPDISDDLQRELAFYSQSLESVRLGRERLRAEGVMFSRPKDYFAEMVKEDTHMEKVRAKLVEEAASKKAAAEARKQRDLKKFGKQVQVAKLQERQKAKRETLDKIKNLKRKRQESGGDMATHEADIFDVGVDHELSKAFQRPSTGRGQMGPGSKVNHKRQKKNEKYGFGGKKRYSKSGDAVSSGDLSGFDVKKMKAGAKGKASKAPRPGRSKRKANAGW